MFRVIKAKKAVSSIVATILLICLAVVGGIIAFYAFSEFAGVSQQKILLDFRNAVLYSTPDQIVCAGTIKNMGTKPAKQINVTLNGEDSYMLPEVTAQSPLEPGETAGFSFNPTKQYVVGETYPLILKAVATDQSTFSHIIVVKCLGLEYQGAHGEKRGIVIFSVSGIGTYGDVVEIDGTSYIFEELPVMRTWPVNSTHYFHWSPIVEFQPGAKKRYSYGYILAEGPSQSIIHADGSGKIVVEEGTTTITGAYATQYQLKTEVFGMGKIKLDIQNSPFPPFTRLVNNATLWLPANYSVTATPVPDANQTFDYWVLGTSQTVATPLTFLMNRSYLLQCYFKSGETAQGSSYDFLEGPLYCQPTGYDFLEGSLYDELTGYDGEEGSIWLAPVGGGADALGAPWGGYYDWATRITRTLTIEVSPQGAGSTDPAPGKHDYPDGMTVAVVAMGHTGYRFNHWVLDGENAGTDDTIFVRMDTDHNLTAYFEEIPKHQLTIQVNNSTRGTTDPVPGVHQYYEGTKVTVSAEPNEGYRLSYWVLDGKSAGASNEISVVMNSDHNLTAYFEEIPKYQLTVQIDDPSHGTTDPTPGVYQYYEGTEVTISAELNKGFGLDYWQVGDSTDTDNPIAIIMDRDYTVVAYTKQIYGNVTFKLENVDVDVSMPPLTVDGIAYSYSQLPITFVWPAYSVHSFSWTSPLSVAEGEVFTWSATTGLSTQPSGAIEVPEGIGEVVGEYVKKFTLTIQVSPADKGDTTPPVGTHWYCEGENVKVTVTPSLGYALAYWVLDGQNIGARNPATVTMNQPHILCAVITQIDLSAIAQRLAVFIPATNRYMLSTYSYVEAFITSDHPELNGHIRGVQFTFKDYSVLQGWSGSQTISLGEETYNGIGSVVKIWNAYVLLDTGDKLRITYEGSDAFYLYWDNTKGETAVTVVDPTGTDP